MEPTIPPRPCRNCGALSPVVPIFGDHSGMIRCEACGGWSHFGELASGAAADLYDEEYFNGGEYSSYVGAGASHRRNFARKLKIMQAHGLPAPAQVRLLEIGAATGEFLQVAREAGIRNGLGLEVSEYGRRIAAERGLGVLSPFDETAQRAIATLSPNVIVGWDVWEHLPDPAATVGALLKTAAPSVLAAFTTVDASSLVARTRGRRWRQFHPPTHLNYPTRRSLQAFFEHRGFRVLCHRPFGYYRPLREYFRGLGVRCGPAPAWDLPVYLDLFDTQLVIARREG